MELKAEWRSMDSVPYGGTPIKLKVMSRFSGRELVFRYCTYIAPIDIDDNGNEYYCYDDMDWFSDPEKYDPEGNIASDWVVGDEILAWMPEDVVWN